MTTTVQSRANLTTTLRHLVRQLDELQTERHRVHTRLFMDTYTWVTMAIDEKAHPNVNQATKTLASTLKRSHRNIEDWYYCGNFMTEFNVPHSAIPQSIRAVYQRKNVVTHANFLKALQLCKDGADYAAVSASMQLTQGAAQKAADTRANKLEAKHQLNRTAVKLEMLACQTIASRVLHQKVEVHIIHPDTGVTILKVAP